MFEKFKLSPLSIFQKKRKKEEIINVEEEEKEEDVEEEVEKDVEEEEEEEEEEEGNVFELHIEHGEKFEVHSHRFFVKMRVKYLLYGIRKSIILYNEENRLVNEERLNHFLQFDITQSDPIILGKYYNEEKECNEYDIIDGQHRIEFFKQNEDKYCNEVVIVDIRTYESKEDYYKILDIINNRVNFDHTQLRKFKYLETKSLLESYFMRKSKKTIYGQLRPYLQEEKFQQKLFQTKFFNHIEHKGDDIFKKLMSINHFLSKKIVEEEKLKSSIKEKCDKLGFYLAVDKEYLAIELLDIGEEGYETFWNRQKRKY